MKNNADNKTLRLLMFGPLPNMGDDHIGGSKVSFRQMVNDLTAIDWLDFRVVSISRPLAGTSSISRLLVDMRFFMYVVWVMLLHGRRYDVWAVHVSAGGLFNLTPVIYFFSVLFRRPLLVRVFGGDLDIVLEKSGWLKIKLFNITTGRCHKLILQTQSLMDQFQHLGNTELLPTSRNLQVKPREKTRCEKLLFMSQVRRDKGVEVAIAASKNLPDGVRIEFYGSPVEPEMIQLIEGSPKAHYFGELKPSEVPDILVKYDLLILPTFWKGEGFPGILIEAFQCGIPVVASEWRQIPEIVKHESNGLLVETGSVESLAAAMNRLIADNELYLELVAGALASGKFYNSLDWNNKFAQWCLEAKSPQYNSFAG